MPQVAANGKRCSLPKDYSIFILREVSLLKGVRETGTIASTPAVVNAICDALAPLGIENIDMPIRPDKIWRILKDKGIT